MIKYAVVFEAPTKEVPNWGAYVPDLPGCITLADTRAECEANIREAIEGHIEALKMFGYPVPEPSSEVEMLDVAA